MKYPINYFIILSFLYFFSACRTIQTNQSEIVQLNAILNNSSNNTDIYIGISPTMRIYEKEVENAKMHIAHQIAIQRNCIVDTGALYILEGKNNFYFSDYGFDYCDDDIDEIVGNLDVLNVYKFQELIIVIGRDTSKPSTASINIPRIPSERPRWINDLQWVRKLLGQGYFAGIGIADKYTQFYKGIYVADIEAAQAIASEKGTSINMYTQDLVVNKSTKYSAGTLSMTENIELEGFYILDRWIDPDNETFYSLGIANKRILK